MNKPATMHTGPLGSTIHVLHADAETVAALAGVDWNRQFRPVCLDPVRGVITLMAPSNRHEDLTSVFDDLVEAAGLILAGAARKLRSPRLRRPDEPPGTGMEPDCAFYVGGRARGYYAACKEGDSAVEAYLEHNAPDLVVEVEVTHADEDKAERYGEMGVRELWRLDGRTGVTELRAEFLALSPGITPRTLDTSVVLEGLAPHEVCEAVDGVRAGPTPEDRKEAVARVVRRRDSVRVREDAPQYSAIVT